MDKDKSTIKLAVKWGILSVILFLLSYLQPLGIFGDSLEYIVQTQSFVFDRSISIDTAKRADYWNRTNPFQKVLTSPMPDEHRAFKLRERSQAGGGFGSLYPAFDGTYYYIHSWIYPLVAAPIYAVAYLFAEISSNLTTRPYTIEYRSFSLLNSMLLAATLAVSVRSISGVLVVILLILSPLSGYLGWTSPEVFQFSLIATAFSIVRKSPDLIPPVLVGLAGAQNFPALVFFLPLLMFQWKENKSFTKQIKSLMPGYLLGGFIGLTPWALYQINFGVPNVIVALGQASIANCSLARLIVFLFSPLVGVFWFFPVYFFTLPYFLSDRESGYSIRGRILLITVVTVLSYAMTGMVNLQSQQLGCARYAAWLFAPLAGILLAATPKNLVSKLFFSIGVIGSSFLIYFYSNFLFPFSKHSRTDYLSGMTKQAERIYRLVDFNEEPEVLVEVIMDDELTAPWEFDSRYEIPVGEGQALCLVSKRSFRNGKTKYLPLESICADVVPENEDQIPWQRSTVQGGYYLKKVGGF